MHLYSQPYWMDDGFVLLKVDLSNVSRQSVLNECVTHFLELLSALGLMVLCSTPFVIA